MRVRKGEKAKMFVERFWRAKFESVRLKQISYLTVGILFINQEG